MKEIKSPKKPLIYYYCIALAVIFLLNNLLFPKMLEMQIKEVDYGTFLSMLEEENIEEKERNFHFSLANFPSFCYYILVMDF